MLRHLRVGIVALAVATASGCAFVHDRANDLLDPFRVDVGYGPGLFAEVRATDFLAAGVGGHGLLTAGMHGRFVGTGERAGLGLPLALLGWVLHDMEPLLQDGSVYDEERDVLSTQLVLVPAVRLGHCEGGYSVARRSVRIADLGASLTLGVVGVSVGFSPGELLDCLLGFVGLDLAGDDVAGRPPVAAAEAEPPDPVGTR